MYKKLYILLTLICIYVIFCDRATSQNYVYTSTYNSGTNATFPFNVIYEDERSDITYQNVSFLADTIFSIGFQIEDRGSFYDYRYQVMYDLKIKFREGSSAWQTVYSGNFAPVQGEWNDIFLDSPYLKQASNNLEVSICFNNCEFNSYHFYTIMDYLDDSFTQNLGNTYFDYSNGPSSLYNSNNTECTLAPSTYDIEVPMTRFGYDNVSRKTINVCSSADSITFVGTSSALPFSQLRDIDNDGSNDFNSPVAYPDINYTTYHYRSRGSVFGSLNWINADYVCQSIGAHLSHIETTAENTFILNNVQGNRNRWIGAYQNCNSSSFLEPSGGWQWTNGKPVSVSRWSPGEPNNSVDEHYATMYAANNSNAGLWNDLGKSSAQRFLMEVEDIYVWSTGDTTTTAELTIASANLNTSSIIWMERLVDEGGRTFKKREYFKIVLNQSPNLVLSSPTNTVCAGDTILVSASSATATLFDWNYGQINPISGMITSQNVNIDDTLTISVTASDVNNCQTTDSIIINTFQISDLNIQVIDSICDSSYAFVNPYSTSLSLTYNYTWSNGITADTIIYNLAPGTYSVSYTDQNGCFAIDSAYVGESAYLSVSADSNQTICYDGQPNNLISQQSLSSFTSTIQWQPDTSFVDATIANPQFINGFSLLNNTLFTVTYDNGTCNSTDTVRIEVRPRPIVSNIVVGPLPACENDTLTITAVYTSTNISEFRFQQKTQSNSNWTNINTAGNGWGFTNPIIFGPIIETTEFRVKIREASGCKPSNWGGPTNQGTIVPINNMNNLLIYHN